MAPRKKATKAKSDMSPALPPLSGLKIALCGTFPALSHAMLKRTIEQLGAESLTKITADASHLVATPNSYNAPSVKTKAAQELGLPILDITWLTACVASNAHEPEAPYLLSSTQKTATTSVPPPAPPAQSTTKGLKSTRKRSAPSPSPDNSNAVSTLAVNPVQPAHKKTKPTNPADTESKSAEIVVPVDEFCPESDVTVHVDGDGTIWDASLNQANAMQNNNKFYIIQILKNKTKYSTWTRWGRVGEKGQSSMLGNGSLDDAMKKFNQKFKDKSGIRWEDRDRDPIPGKYAYIERSYQPDSDDDEKPEPDTDIGEKQEEYEPPACTLLAPVQSLVELIFNRQFFEATMSDLNYDARKLPLGKLSKSTITRGFQALKNLSELLDNPDLAQSLYNLAQPAAIANLSNLYYSVIPHVFGRNRPPIIGDHIRLKREIDLLDSLSDMKAAELLMKVGPEKLIQKAHPADLHYQGLGMKEMTPLEHSSNEFQELANYLSLTRGSTHNVRYMVQDIFRIERQNEQSRFDGSIVSGPTKDKRLLWHGSRVTNFAGILSQGLRIAPPEAPVSGYMFGKGIYLADMSSKSANYCCSHMSNGTALLLLCEADLGVPLYELMNSSYTAGEDAREKGMFTTLGKGVTAPLAWKDAGCVHEDLTGVTMPDVSVPPGNTGISDACLQYNEYIVYDVSQIRLRYLFKVRM